MYICYVCGRNTSKQPSHTGVDGIQVCGKIEEPGTCAYKYEQGRQKQAMEALINDRQIYKTKNG